MKCLCCEHWKIGIPIGTCLHPKGRLIQTYDSMVFEDASERCPKTKENKKEEQE